MFCLVKCVFTLQPARATEKPLVNGKPTNKVDDPSRLANKAEQSNKTAKIGATVVPSVEPIQLPPSFKDELKFPKVRSSQRSR